jgi:uncharacterized protein (TIGR02597 family)
MKKRILPRLLPAALVGASFFAASTTHAQTTFTTEPLGFLATTCLGGSDTVISVPFSKNADLLATVGSVNAASSQLTLSVSDMVTDEFMDSHYVRFGDNSSLEGAKMTVSANTPDTLTLDIPSGYSLGSASVGDEVALIPHMTVGELFAGVPNLPDGTEVFFFNNASNGINKASAGGYIYSAPDWYDADTFEVANGAVLFPDETLVVRVPGDSANDFVLTKSGAVPTVGHSFPIVTSAVGANDNFVSPQIPAEVEIGSLFSNASDGDEILIIDNSVRAQNKASSGGYIYVSPSWYDADTFAVVDAETVKPWEIAIYRRADQGGVSTAIFSGRSAYLNDL